MHSSTSSEGTNDFLINPSPVFFSSKVTQQLEEEEEEEVSCYERRNQPTNSHPLQL